MPTRPSRQNRESHNNSNNNSRNAVHKIVLVNSMPGKEDIDIAVANLAGLAQKMEENVALFSNAQVRLSETLTQARDRMVEIHSGKALGVSEQAELAREFRTLVARIEGLVVEIDAERPAADEGNDKKETETETEAAGEEADTNAEHAAAAGHVAIWH